MSRTGVVIMADVTRPLMSLAATLLTLGWLVGCGSAGETVRLSPQAAAQLHRELAAANSAAQEQHPNAAQRALDSVARTVAQQRGAGRLDQSQVSAFRTGIAQASRHLRAEIHAVPVPALTPATTPQATPAVTPSAAAATPPPGPGKAKDNGKGKGKGKGK